MNYKQAIELVEWIKVRDWLMEHGKTWRDLERDEFGQFICMRMAKKGVLTCEEKIYLPDELK